MRYNNRESQMKRKKTKSILDVIKSIRKPMPPAVKVHTTKNGKKGYDRKENKRIEREAKSTTQWLKIIGLAET